MKQSFFLFIITGMMICSATPVDHQSIHKDLEEDTRYYPASVEAIEYSYKRCLDRILSDIKESIEIEKDEAKGMLELIQCYEKTRQDGLYHIWGLGGGMFKKLLEEYENAPLFFINGSEALDEDGLLINHIEGIGVRKGDKIKLLSTWDDHLTMPSFSVVDISALEELENQILQAVQQEGGDISQLNATTLTEKDKKVLGDWSAYAERMQSESDSILDEMFSDNKGKDTRELDMSNVDIMAIVSLPFIEYMNQYLSMRIHLIFASQKNEILAKKQGKTAENIGRDIRIMFEKGLEVSSVSPPLGMSKMQWRTIVRESKTPNSLWFYRKTVKYQDLDLLIEVGFVIKQNDKIVRKIPLQVDIISYTLPK